MSNNDPSFPRVVYSDCPWPCRNGWLRPKPTPEATPNQIVSDSFDQMAQRIAALLERGALPEAVPLLISGDWGAGKTSLLVHACYLATGHSPQGSVCAHGALEVPPTNKHGPKPVWFEAWRYEGHVVLLPALLRAIWESLPDGEKGKPENKRRLVRMAWAAALVAVRVGPLAVGAMTGLSAAAYGLLAPLFTGITGDLKSMIEESTKGHKRDPLEDPNDVLEKELAAVVAGTGASAERPLLVFIDDLDRCGPDSAVTLLDAIRRIVLGSPRIHCRFVVALDRSVMTAAIAHKFAGLPRFDAQRYLEKIFPIAFHLGNLPEDEGRRLLSQLVGNARVEVTRARDAAFKASLLSQPKDSQADTQRIQHAVDGLRRALDDPLFFNPRLLKRCINRFWLALGFEEQRSGVSRVNGVDEQRVLAQWIAATERWPRLRTVLQRHQDNFWMGLLRAAHSSAEARPSDGEVRQLLEEPGLADWLDRAVGVDLEQLTELRRADERLRAVGL